MAYKFQTGNIEIKLPLLKLFSNLQYLFYE
jgi:hypothetical protein